MKPDSWRTSSLGTAPPSPRPPLRVAGTEGARGPMVSPSQPGVGGQRLVVGIGEFAVSNKKEDVIITHALGSCIAVCLWDPTNFVAGLLHFLLPDSRINQQLAKDQPPAYSDAGIPLLFNTAYNYGHHKKQCILRLAGRELGAVQGTSERPARSLEQVGGRCQLAQSVAQSMGVGDRQLHERLRIAYVGGGCLVHRRCLLVPAELNEGVAVGQAGEGVGVIDPRSLDQGEHVATLTVRSGPGDHAQQLVTVDRGSDPAGQVHPATAQLHIVRCGIHGDEEPVDQLVMMQRSQLGRNRVAQQGVARCHPPRATAGSDPTVLLE